MNGLKSLIWREWREVRGVTIGCAVVSIVASIVVNHFAFKWKDPQAAGSVLVSLPTLLMCVILASDLISSDLKSRRIEPLALLPVPLRTVLLAKVLFLFGATLAFAVLLIGVQCVSYALSGHIEWFKFLMIGLEKAQPLFAFTAVGAAAIVFFSALSLRSFVSALLGLVSVGGILAIGAWYELPEVLNLKGMPDMWWVFGGLVVVFAAAAATAFLRGPAHSSSKRRLWAVGLAAMAACAIPISGGVAWAVHKYFDVAPGMPDVRLDDLHVSPDESLLAFTAHRTVRQSGSDIVVETWVLDLATGEMVHEFGRGVRLAGWSRRNEICVWRADVFRGLGKRENSGWLADPRTGSRTQTLTPKTVGTELLSSMRQQPKWGKSVATSRGGGRKYSVRLTHGPDASEVLFDGFPCLLTKRGLVLAVNADGEFALHDIIKGTKRVLVKENASNGGPWSSSPSERYATCTVNEHPMVIEIATGRVVLIDETVKGSFQWARSGGKRDVLVVHDEERAIAKLVDLDRDVTIDFDGKMVGHNFFHVRPLRDGRIVMIASGARVVLIGTDGTIARTLYQPD